MWAECWPLHTHAQVWTRTVDRKSVLKHRVGTKHRSHSTVGSWSLRQVFQNHGQDPIAAGTFWLSLCSPSDPIIETSLWQDKNGLAVTDLEPDPSSSRACRESSFWTAPSLGVLVRKWELLYKHYQGADSKRHTKGPGLHSPPWAISTATHYPLFIFSELFAIGYVCAPEIKRQRH